MHFFEFKVDSNIGWWLLFYTLLMISGIGSQSGAGGLGILAYFFLDMVGWRVFTVMVSVPLFLAAIFILVFILKDDEMPDKPWYHDVNESKVDYAKDIPLSASLGLVFPLLIQTFIITSISDYLGGGMKLFLPNAFRKYNSKVLGTDVICTSRMQSYQFLAYSVVIGGSCIQS